MPKHKIVVHDKEESLPMTDEPERGFVSNDR